MKTNYAALKNCLERGDDVQVYTFSQIEDIIGTNIPTYYINRRTFKQKSTSRFQMAAIEVGFLLTDVDYEGQTLTFTKNDGRIIEPSSRVTTHRRPYQPVKAVVSEQALNPNDLGKDLDSAVDYFKNHWRSTGRNPLYVPFRGKYASLEEVYYHAGDKAYRASVNNRIPLFEGMANRNKALLREQSIRYLSEQFAVLFGKEEMNFEIFSEWEYQVATRIREIYHNGGVRLYTYGNAQKLINVALKFVLSSDIVDYHHEVFKYCFFPIDGIIQRILKGQLAVDFLHLNGQRRYYQPSWARCDNWDDILEYQIRVREAVLTYGYYSPIVWEATHWN